MADPESSLRLCLRSRWDPAAASELAAKAAQPDWNWEALASLALAEGLAPLLHAQLSHSPLWATLPAEVRDMLVLAHEGSAIRSAVLLAGLEEILDRLRRAGVSALLLKGAAVAERLYGDPALRPMNDLDLLIHEADVEKALAVLMACGYRTTRVEERPGIAIGYESEIALARPGLIGISVELHWRLFDSPLHRRRVDAGWFWEAATPLQIAGHEVRTLSSTALFLYLAGHLMLHHRGEGMRWWLDLVALIHHAGEQIDWSTLSTRADAFALIIPLQQATETLVNMWGVHIAPDAMKRLMGLRPSAAERRAYARLRARSRSAAQRFWSNLVALPTWKARAHFAWMHMVPTPAYMAARYRPPHPWLIPLLYPWRWLIGLAGVATSAAIRRSG
ncbi:MAG: nucleotidyltransferase family protein [Anaerolineae bacterium]